MNESASKLVVRSVTDDEFHLVVFSQPVQIGKVVVFNLATTRTFDIDHFHDVVRHVRDIDMTTGLQKHRLA